VAVIEPLAARSWKAVEVFGTSKLCVSHFYLRFLVTFSSSSDHRTGHDSSFGKNKTAQIPVPII
jgi:hypothetical protein